ncbi:MAG: hypothetical protein P8I55_12400 [Crocinitomix sp.]|nr:hypothetical protein [Crocinitomix sp.]
MELFGKIFIILTTGVFLALFMLLVEHSKRWQIGAGLFAIVVLLTLSSIPVFMLFAALSPLLILLDAKRLSWFVCLRHLELFILLGAIWALYIIDYISFYYYPFIVSIYLVIAKANAQRSSLKVKPIDEIN